MACGAQPSAHRQVFRAHALAASGWRPPREPWLHWMHPCCPQVHRPDAVTFVSQEVYRAALFAVFFAQVLAVGALPRIGACAARRGCGSVLAPGGSSCPPCKRDGSDGWFEPLQPHPHTQARCSTARGWPGSTRSTASTTSGPCTAWRCRRASPTLSATGPSSWVRAGLGWGAGVHSGGLVGCPHWRVRGLGVAASAPMTLNWRPDTGHYR